LYRDGQLVAQWPVPEEHARDRSELETWQSHSRILPSEVSHGLPPFKVRLASRDRGRRVIFTAYAFNEDRVKSQTATNGDYKVPEDVPRRHAKAYVITIGVSTYDNPSRNLRYAAKDARVLTSSLSHLPGYESILVSMISEVGRKDMVRPTKANIRAVVRLLSGQGEEERARLRQELGPVVDKLNLVTPDDLVILTFSGHGHTERDGRFFILPTDSGTADQLTAADLLKLISSEELSEWLRGVDAGQMVMILDACYAAGATDSGDGEFKPGPMGDRGLGQLAYDKRMRILAATQAADVALESDKLEQGLLTYALVHDGLEQHKADLDHSGAITLAEWLEYAAARVPVLYQDVVEGRRVLRRRGEVITSRELRSVVESAQTPELFDFYREGHDIVLWEKRADPRVGSPGNRKKVRHLMHPARSNSAIAVAVTTTSPGFE
jgi:hypothetical protein